MGIVFGSLDAAEVRKQDREERIRQAEKERRLAEGNHLYCARVVYTVYVEAPDEAEAADLAVEATIHDRGHWTCDTESIKEVHGLPKHVSRAYIGGR